MKRRRYTLKELQNMLSVRSQCPDTSLIVTFASPDIKFATGFIIFFGRGEAKLTKRYVAQQFDMRSV